MKISGLTGLIIISAVVAITAVVFSLINKPMFFKTSDNVKIAYDLYEVNQPKGWLILAHMMPATKESWRDFAVELQKYGYESLAVDLRGHGESGGGPDGFKKFSDGEHQASIRDLEAGWEFLKSRGAAPEKSAVIGASIGANLSLQFAVSGAPIKNIILLSPGLNYRGIITLPLAKELENNRELLIATSKDDDDNAAESRQLYEAAPQSINKHLILFDRGGHGTDLLGHPEEYNLIKSIRQFLTDGSIY